MDVILDIEVQGARQVNEKMPDAVKVFIIPPSMDELKRRLESRGTDTARAIEARLIRARQEYKEADFMTISSSTTMPTKRRASFPPL